MTSTLPRVDGLLPDLAERAPEIDRTGRIPDDVISGLAAAGCLRMLVPAAHGGADLPLVEALRVVEQLSVADSSTGWLVGQVGLAHLLFACFPEAARREIYADGPDVLGAGAVAPKGRAAPDGAGGWQVNGRWPFVTGAPQASWIYLNCLVLDGRTPRTLPNGAPLTRMVLFPAAELELVDTWQVLGLRGTASLDVRAAARTCPEHRGFSLVGGGDEVHRTVFRIAQAGLLIAAVDLGIAQGAVGDAAAQAAAGRRRTFSTRSLADSPVFHDRLGEAHVALRAARALLHAEAETAWETARRGEVLSPLDRACLRATAAQVTAVAHQAVQAAYALAGASTVFDGSPLQRRLRDINTATQHFVNGRDSYATVGALLAGAPVDTTMF
ncbi:acyl-CoA dehydrogenase family protein [Micromonospora humi]|uniref:Acyl-CoA dehydrogenase n=1 Tax=Micromonospora humi TaxID=745366 RepID=A0A1C5H0V8_9ACTN|nr:acyl-CoA dehydrogenase family protein [Micromonospora humi]SCG39618.1 Acyl-CoA dehydrogenase [Micromonospora humi]